MTKDPAFLFYPGDYLRDTQCLSANSQVAYDRLMCEHMRNICISQQQLNFFFKRLTEEEKNEVLAVLTKIKGGFQIHWVAESICKRRLYSDSRAKNRKGKLKNISKSYDNHMENEIEIVNETKIVTIGKGKGRGKPKILFRESPYFGLTAFEMAFFGTEYESLDLKHYHAAALNWSDGNGNKKIDWIATVKGWMNRDLKETKNPKYGTAKTQQLFTGNNGKLSGNEQRLDAYKNY